MSGKREAPLLRTPDLDDAPEERGEQGGLAAEPV